MFKKNELQKPTLVINYTTDQVDPGKKHDEDDEKDMEEENPEELEEDDEDDVNGDDVENIHIYNRMRIYYTTQSETTFEIDPSYK
jgi:hypothetical protein